MPSLLPPEMSPATHGRRRLRVSSMNTISDLYSPVASDVQICMAAFYNRLTLTCILCLWAGTVVGGCAPSVYIKWTRGALTGRSRAEKKPCRAKYLSTCWWGGHVFYSLALVVSLSPLCHQQQCHCILLRLCAADVHVVSANSSPSVSVHCFHGSISPIFRPVWVFHRFSHAAKRVRCLQGAEDVSGHHSGKAPAAALPDHRSVCVWYRAHFHQMRFTQPGKECCYVSGMFRLHSCALCSRLRCSSPWATDSRKCSMKILWTFSALSDKL